MLLRMALDLWEEHHAGETTDFVARAAELRFVASYLLRERSLRDPDNQRLLKALRQYHRRGELLRFLEDQHRAHQQLGGTGFASGGDCP